mmetsp:Transcript_30015/g.48502  ORF Transcript_30015/g.48502 Transcript_30015/m.48502 type:complete len:200 (-) Transcript_30015:172-771(-)
MLDEVETILRTWKHFCGGPKCGTDVHGDIGLSPYFISLWELSYEPPFFFRENLKDLIAISPVLQLSIVRTNLIQEVLFRCGAQLPHDSVEVDERSSRPGECIGVHAADVEGTNVFFEAPREDGDGEGEHLRVDCIASAGKVTARGHRKVKSRSIIGLNRKGAIVCLRVHMCKDRTRISEQGNDFVGGEAHGGSKKVLAV